MIIENEPVILPDESIVAVGIDYIEVVIGGIHVFGQSDYNGKVNNFQFKFEAGWEHSSIKELEEFIRCELSKELCPVN